MKPDHKELQEKIMAGVNESMDKLILERMTTNRAMVVESDGKVQKISPFTLAEERWGKEFVETWKRENKRQ